MNATDHSIVCPVIWPHSEGPTAIHNTPAVVLANGKCLVGATPPEQFLQGLAAASR